MTTIPKLSGITLPGTGYPKLINFAAPDLPQGAANLVGLYTLGGPLSFSTFNFANPDLPLTAIGAPAMSDVGAALNRTNYFDTHLPSTAAMTIMAVARPIVDAVAANNQFMVSNFPSGDVLGFLPSSGAPAFRASIRLSSGVTPSEILLTGADNTKWNTFAGRYRANGQVKAFRSVDGAVTSSVESAVGTRAIGGPNLTLGREYSGAVNGTVNEAMVAIFNTDLSDAQIAENMEYLREEWGPALGITTL